MMRIHVFLASLVALTSPAVAASTPGELVQELSRTAHDSDQKGFLAAMSASTRRVMAEAEAMGSKLTPAQKDFSTALGPRDSQLRTARQYWRDLWLSTWWEWSRRRQRKRGCG
jgi:hypothetical protein